MGGTGLFPEIPFVTGLYELSDEHVKAECVRTVMGIPRSDHPRASAQPDPQDGDPEEDPAADLRAELYLGHRTLRYGPHVPFSGGADQFIIRDRHQLDDNAGSIPDDLHRQRDLADRRVASKDLEEAAIVDGANILQQIRYVQLPAIKDIIVIQFILQAGNIMSIGFEKAYALQTDMNLPASEILSTYVYRLGLLNGDYGYSTAVGLFNSVINVILLIFVNWVVKKLNDGEGL